MDVEKALNNFASKEHLIQFIRDLPDDAVGAMMFTYDAGATNEEGEELELNVFKYYGGLHEEKVLWMLMRFIDYVRRIG